MANQARGDRPSPTPPPGMDPALYARIKAEAEAPYRGLRRFIYLAFGASGLIGGVVFLAKLAAGQDIADNLPNFALQAGVVALMVWLFRLENRAEKRAQDKPPREQSR
jgi:hypothetical protein